MKQGIKFERQLAKELNGRVQPGSGAPWGVKGDIEIKKSMPKWWNGVLVEAKDSNKSFQLKQETWEKIQTEADSEGKLGVMMIGFQNSTVAVVDYQVLMDLLKAASELEDVLQSEFSYD